MKDIQKIKEFFSKPLNEEETAIDMAQKQLDQLGAKYEMSGNKFKPFKVIYKPIGKSDGWYDKFDEIVDLFNLGSAVKSSMSEASPLTKLGRKIGWAGEDWTPQEFAAQIKKLSDETLLKWAEGNKGIGKGIPNTPLAFQQKLVKIELAKRGLTEAKEEDLPIQKYKIGDIIQTKNSKQYKIYAIPTPENPKYSKGIVLATPVDGFGGPKSININTDIEKLSEAKEEDAVDTITMDIPLFLRMLEYSREDAQKDLDLHDVTEKANLLGKERGILSMEDYNEIVGAAEEIDEAVNLKASKLSSAEYQKAKKLKDFKSSDWKWNADEDLYTKVNERIAEVLDKINEELCPAGKAYIKRRKAAGEKSSAYLSGRGVKVCKGQMSGKAKKK